MQHANRAKDEEDSKTTTEQHAHFQLDEEDEEDEEDERYEDDEEELDDYTTDSPLEVEMKRIQLRHMVSMIHDFNFMFYAA